VIIVDHSRLIVWVIFAEVRVIIRLEIHLHLVVVLRRARQLLKIEEKLYELEIDYKNNLI
jgi:hypothetical protein